MPNRPKGKHTISGKNSRKDPYSNRSLGRGIETADGKFQSGHDLRMLEAQGTRMDRVFPGLVNG